MKNSMFPLQTNAPHHDTMTARRIRAVVALVCVVVVCSGCGKRPTIGKITSDSVVLAFGDSITYGLGRNSPDSYPSVLAELLGCRVINAGVGGEDTAGGLKRLPAVLERHQPDLVILCLGGNDMLRKQNEQLTRQNLDAMLTQIKNHGADVLLLGVPKPAIWLKSPPFYRELATKHDIPVDTTTLPRIYSRASLRSDRIHPNEKGYRKLAEAIAKLIVRSQRG